MNLTFGICTDGKNPERVNRIIDSIKSLNIEKYEIIQEIRTDGYITIQKNNITKKAGYDNIVYLHDYVSFDKNWYKALCNYGEDFDILVTRIEDDTGLRFRDWCLWYQDMFELPLANDVKAEMFAANQNYLIPYHWKEFTKYQYISGAFWIAKKRVMLESPLDEKLAWAQGEDVEWSKRVRVKYRMDVVPEAIVRFIKPGKIRIFNEMQEKHRTFLQGFLK